jgi:PKD repeat protein
MDPFGPAADTAAGGDIVAVWAGYSDETEHGLLSARAYDVDGPLVNALSIPATGMAGTPVAFSVTAVDAWSAVASTSWSFGDGTTASGATVSHTYAAAGSYAVAVTVTDAVGNARTRTGSVVVSAKPVVVVVPEPQLTGVKLTKKTIHVKSSDESPTATKLKLKLNTDAKVKVVLKRTQKVDGKAVKATVTKALEKGSSAIKLTSKVGGKKLPPGIYKVKVTAKNSVGRSAATTVKLTIKR